MGYVLDDAVIEQINHISPGAQRTGLGDLVDKALGGVLPPGSVSLAEIETGIAGRVIGSNGVGVANTWKTISAGVPAFTGTPATVSPTAALDAAPVFTGTPATISPTAALDAAPVFTGTPATISPAAALDAAPVFTGNAMGNHQHAAESAGTPAGTVAAPQLNIASPVFTGTGITAAGQDMTTTDNQTMTLNQCAGMWLYPVTGATPPVLILSNTAVTGAPAVFTVQGAAFTDVGAYYVVGNNAPAFTGNAMGNHQHAAESAGTPAGTNDAPAITVTGAAYTPAGTNDAPAITVTGAAYTPAGTNDTPGITVTGAAYTPAGTVAAPTISLT
jgi:hypothetical protein